MVEANTDWAEPPVAASEYDCSELFDERIHQQHTPCHTQGMQHKGMKVGVKSPAYC